MPNESEGEVKRKNTSDPFFNSVHVAIDSRKLELDICVHDQTSVFILKLFMEIAPSTARATAVNKSRDFANAPAFAVDTAPSLKAVPLC